MIDSMSRNQRIDSDDGCSAWNPGVGTGIPGEFRALETIFRPECVLAGANEVREFAGLTGLPEEELAVFRPQRLVLHEIIVRVTADIAVAEGALEEDFGWNFRRIAGQIRDTYVGPHKDAIENAYAELRQNADHLIRQILAETLFCPPAPPEPRSIWSKLSCKAPAAEPEPETGIDRDHRVIAEYKAAGLRAENPLRKAVYRSLYRVLGAILGKRGSVISDRDLLAKLVGQHVGNSYGSHLIGQLVAPLVDAAIAREGYARVPDRETPVLISLKGASASGKSSLRPTIKQIMRDQGIEADGYATISPDVWRRLLLDYESLGPAHKFAGHLTSRELAVVDGKLDRYIRDKANRHHAIPHFLVDRFRFDSFSSEKVGRVLHDTYAKYVDTMVMYFFVTPPEETVARGWQRALERGRYKAVEDFLGHSVEAYTGMPKIFFKWLGHRHPDYRYFFLDNLVPRGDFPKTIAFGDQTEMTLYDPAAFIDIERYQKINVNAHRPEDVYPPAPLMAVAANSGFLKECLRRIPLVNFTDRASGVAYLRVRNGKVAVLDAGILLQVLHDKDTAAALGQISGFVAPACLLPEPE
ncbi:MAG: zeta toxin family protein [Betaproteobacteria bacterium]|nr:zeta toxin family protein [Betaproteobacteria bacterium]